MKLASLSQLRRTIIFIATLVLCSTQLTIAATADRRPVRSTARKLSRANRVTVRPAVYRGWRDALIISNGTIEVVVVPAINRVIQFCFVNEDGVFWENDALAGELPDPTSEGWKNFGGDKTWVAPQSEWQPVAGRTTPTVAFNALPATAKTHADGVELVSQIDEHYGIRARRFIRLDDREPVMTITTVYEKLAGDPRRVSVWIITQLKEPRGVFIPVPRSSVMPESYVKLGRMKAVPPSLTITNKMMSLVRDKTANYKIGSDAGTLLWIDARHTLRIDSPRTFAVEYPDANSSAEVYTNKDPLAYVELEMLSPLKTMSVGDTLSQTNTYTLRRRTKRSLTADVRAALK